jgi:hypothetical protein
MINPDRKINPPKTIRAIPTWNSIKVMAEKTINVRAA